MSTDDLRLKLFNDHIDHVNYCVDNTLTRCPAHIRISYREDMTMIGLTALWNCTDTYAPTPDAKFWSYANKRVRGAIIDELRGLDWMPRTLRIASKEVHARMREMEQELGHQVTFLEACKDLGIEASKATTLNRLDSTDFISLDSQVDDIENDHSFSDFVPDEHAVSQSDSLQITQDYEFIRRTLGRMKSNHATLIHLYFWGEMQLTDIGISRGVTKSCICKLLADAVARFKKIYMLGHYDCRTS